MRYIKKYPKSKYLNEIFYYNNGYLYWKKTNKMSHMKKHDIVGYNHNSGYRMCNIDNIQYMVHRLIYIFHHGNIKDVLHIDHVDGNPLNNNIKNLRLVTCQENQFNTSHTGYYYNKKSKTWIVRISSIKERLYLGSFKKESDAKECYQKAKQKYHKIGGQCEV